MSIIGPDKPLCSRSKSFQFPNLKNRLADVSLLGALLLAGCFNEQLRVTPIGGSAALSGAVYGGQRPISGASIQLYVAGASGDGSMATPLLTSVTTDSSGSFNLTRQYACPTPATEVYLVATGGNPGLMNGGTNAQIALMAALGPCGNLTATTSVEINEVTTVAAVYALAPYMKSYSEVGSNAGDVQMMAGAFAMAAELANTGTGSAPGVDVPMGQTVPLQKLNTLASIVAPCINSAGGKAGDSSPCGQLFSLASAVSGDAPTDTVGALLDIARNPTSNVVPIFDLDPPMQLFQPSLSSAPADWTIAISSTTPSPGFSPSPGTYDVSPSVILSDSNLSAAIYYTTDGSQPTSSSIPYTGAIVLSGTTTIRAVAIAGGISSLLVAGIYALAAPAISLTPASVTLSSTQVEAFAATVSGTSNTAVTWSLSPAVGSISAGGLYTAPASISSAQTIIVTATSVADSTKTASATVSLAPLASSAATYYMSPVGSDSNPGTSASPWASPNHALNCGDTITAVAGAYNVNSFHFGVVTCSAGNNVAWLQCATAFACTGSVTSGGQYSQGIGIGESYWGVQGWLVTTGAGEADCFAVAPNSSSVSISHIIFANDIANGCGKAGFEATTNGSAGVDYFAVVGSIVYGAAAGSTLCESGINSFSPVATDTLPGTHYYYAGNFSFDNVNPIPCNGSSPSTDGEGLFFDTMGAYNQQMVMDNNLAAFNGGNGIKSYNSTSGANIYVRHNTTVADETGGVNGAICSEIGFQSTLNAQAYLNLAQTGATTGCSGPSAIYVLAASSANSTISFTNNYGYSTAGNDSLAGGATLSGNTFANPLLSNPVNPSAPSCGGFSTTTACMATVIANFAPTASAAMEYGYQPPSDTPVYDPLFPLWLCNINLPSDLVTMGCLTAH